MEFKELGEFLESLRGKMSLRDAAKKSGLSHTYIRRLELGINKETNEIIKPSPETLKMLANAYNHSYEDLLTKAGYLTESESNFIRDLYLTEEELINKYKLTIEGKEVSKDELIEAIQYIKFKRMQK